MTLHVCNHCSNSYEELEVLIAEHDTICRQCFEAYMDLQREMEQDFILADRVLRTEDELPF